MWSAIAFVNPPNAPPAIHKVIGSIAYEAFCSVLGGMLRGRWSYGDNSSLNMTCLTTIRGFHAKLRGADTKIPTTRYINSNSHDQPSR